MTNHKKPQIIPMQYYYRTKTTRQYSHFGKLEPEKVSHVIFTKGYCASFFLRVPCLRTHPNMRAAGWEAQLLHREFASFTACVSPRPTPREIQSKLLPALLHLFRMTFWIQLYFIMRHQFVLLLAVQRWDGETGWCFYSRLCGLERLALSCALG